MNDSPNPRLSREDDDWILILERVLNHPVGDVWDALTDAGQLPDWGPFRTDRSLTSIGAVRLAHIGNPAEDVRQGFVLEANAPHLLVFKWGQDILRWELTGQEDRTVLVLRHRFADRSQAPSYAAGWHLCLDGLTGILDGKQMPSMVGHNAAKYGYHELHAQYARQFDKTQPRGRLL